MSAIQVGPHEIDPRAVVEHAASIVTAGSVRTWLTFDEFGKWEHRSRELLGRASLAERVLAEQATSERVVREVGTVIALMAVEAALAHASKAD